MFLSTINMLQPVISGLLKNSSSYTDPPNIISRQTFLAIQSMQDTNPYVNTGTKWFQSSTNIGRFHNMPKTGARVPLSDQYS